MLGCFGEIHEGGDGLIEAVGELRIGNVALRVERLMRLLREMSVDTQFIIITHSKRTMESAQSMYGVTMQEAGISRLVSVKFQQMAAAQAAVPAA